MITLNLFVFALGAFLTEGAVKSPRLMNSQDAHSEVKFPHHVLVGPCGGSIISNKWILTSKTCISQTKDNLEIKFRRFNVELNVFSVNVKIDSDSVREHPFSDIALVKLPVDLRFDEKLKSINLYEAGMTGFNESTIGVVPGFEDGAGAGASGPKTLKYGIYQFDNLFNGECKRNKTIDEHTQICSKSYDGYPNNPLCKQDFGSGLVIGWLQKPYLVGILSRGTCGEVPYNEIFTKVDAFSAWINKTTSI